MSIHRLIIQFRATRSFPASQTIQCLPTWRNGELKWHKKYEIIKLMERKKTKDTFHYACFKRTKLAAHLRRFTSLNQSIEQVWVSILTFKPNSNAIRPGNGHGRNVSSHWLLPWKFSWHWYRSISPPSSTFTPLFSSDSSRHRSVQYSDGFMACKCLRRNLGGNYSLRELDINFCHGYEVLFPSLISRLIILFSLLCNNGDCIDIFTRLELYHLNCRWYSNRLRCSLHYWSYYVYFNSNVFHSTSNILV